MHLSACIPLAASLFFLLGGVTEAAPAAAKATSNAQRLMRGLPPLAPKKLFDPTKRKTAQLQKRSALPVTPTPASAITFVCPGTMGGCCSQLYDNTGQPYLGDCIGKWKDAQGRFTCDNLGLSQPHGVPYCQYPGTDIKAYASSVNYKCPTPSQQTASCCDSPGSLTCVDATFLNAPNTYDSFSCPNFSINSDTPYPTCCSDLTFTSCTNAVAV